MSSSAKAMSACRCQPGNKTLIDTNDKQFVHTLQKQTVKERKRKASLLIYEARSRKATQRKAKAKALRVSKKTSDFTDWHGFISE
jgi:hypothetical protein